MDDYNSSMIKFRQKEPVVNSANARVSTLEKSQPLKKKSRNAFILFSMDYRRKLKEDGVKIKSAEIMKIIGEKYRTLSFEERNKYDQLAKEEQLAGADILTKRKVENLPEAAIIPQPTPPAKVKKV